MRYIGTALAVLLVVGGAGAALATAPAAGGGAAATAGAAAALTIPAADATRLKDWITAQKTASIAKPAGLTIAVGTELPKTVGTRIIGITPQVSAVDPGKYQYAVVDNNIVLVEMPERKIVYVFS